MNYFCDINVAENDTVDIETAMDIIVEELDHAAPALYIRGFRGHLAHTSGRCHRSHLQPFQDEQTN